LRGGLLMKSGCVAITRKQKNARITRKHFLLQGGDVAKEERLCARALWTDGQISGTKALQKPQSSGTTVLHNLLNRLQQ
jgi:hypothetical protein